MLKKLLHINKLLALVFISILLGIPFLIYRYLTKFSIAVQKVISFRTIKLLVLLVIMSIVLVSFAYPLFISYKKIDFDEFQSCWRQEAKGYVDKSNQILYDRILLKGNVIHAHLIKRPESLGTNKRKKWHIIKVPLQNNNDELVTRLALTSDFKHIPFGRDISILWAMSTKLAGIILLYIIIVEVIKIRNDAIIYHVKGRKKINSIFLAPALFAFVVLAFLLWLHINLIPPDYYPEIRQKLFQVNSVHYLKYITVPYLILWTFFFGLFYLLISRHIHFIPLKRARTHESFILESNQESINRYLNNDQYDGYYKNIIKRLLSCYAVEGDNTKVQQLKDEIIDEDAQRCHLSFAAVHYVEFALPILGFMGTVLGIGTAIAGLQQGIDFDKNTLIPNNISMSFSGMASAFDTTFYGLVGLIIIGGLHFYYRKRVDQELMYVQIKLTEVIEKWNSFDLTENLASELRGFRSELNDYHTSLGNIIDVIIHEDERFSKIKNVLYYPLVSFSRTYESLNRHSKKEISNKVGVNWKYISLSSPVYGGDCYSALLNSNQDYYLYMRSITGQKTAIYNLDTGYTRHYMCDEKNILLCVEESYLKWFSSGQATKFILQDDSKPILFYEDDLVLPYYLDGRSSCIIIHNDSDRRIISQVYAGSLQSQVLFDNVTKQSFPWKIASISPYDGRLALTGKKEGEWHLQLFSLNEKKTNIALNPLIIRIGDIGEISQMQWLSTNEILILGTIPTSNDNQLFLFNLDRQLPIPLKHNNANPSRIYVGHNRWCALYHRRGLSMYRVAKYGKLISNGSNNTLPAENIKPQNMCVALKGKCLLGATDQELLAWNYPQNQCQF